MGEQGYIQVYTGNGKGKTTAAFGLALRAAMADKKVWIGQFMKGTDYSELKVAKYIENIKIEQLGNECFVGANPRTKDYEDAENGLNRVREALKLDYDLIILDELNCALFFGLLNIEDVIEVINSRKPEVEIIITGRYAPDEIIEIAHLVTEMKEIKHYYTQGVLARKGIEY